MQVVIHLDSSQQHYIQITIFSLVSAAASRGMFNINMREFLFLCTRRSAAGRKMLECLQCRNSITRSRIRH